MGRRSGSPERFFLPVIPVFISDIKVIKNIILILQKNKELF